jgi:hypothetical protein
LQLAAGDSSGGPTYYAVSRERCEYGDLNGWQFAERLNVQLRPALPQTEANIRKIVPRARERFGRLLVEEVRCALGSHRGRS